MLIKIFPSWEKGIEQNGRMTFDPVELLGQIWNYTYVWVSDGDKNQWYEYVEWCTEGVWQ